MYVYLLYVARPAPPRRHPLPPLIHTDPASYIDSNIHTENMCMSAVSREPLQLFMTGAGQGYVKGKGMTPVMYDKHRRMHDLMLMLML